MSSATRALGASEFMVHLLDQTACLNFVMIGWLSHPPPVKAIETALTQLQLRHPLLRVALHDHLDGYPKFVEVSRPIPFRVMEVSSAQVSQQASFEANLRFDIETGPLVRCVLLKHPENGQATLLAAFHHAIGDGTSGAYLFRDLLKLIAEPELSLEERPAAALEQHLPPLARGIGGWMRHIALMGRMIYQMILRGLPKGPQVERWAEPEERKVHLALRTISKDRLDHLLKLAKSHKVTLHGVLGAALMIASREGDTSGRMVLGSPVNLRDRLQPSLSDEIGLYVTMVATAHTMQQKEAAFWALAADISRQLKGGIQRHEPLVGWPLQNISMAWLGRLYARSKEGARKFTLKLAGSYPTAIGLSNLGKLSIESQYGDLKVQRIGFGAAMSVLGILSGFTATLDTTLSLTVSGMMPMISPERTEAIAEAWVAQLLRLTAGAAEVS